MTLQHLYDQLASSFKPSVRKDIQTAIRVLAGALDCPSPAHCHADQFHRPLPQLYERVERYQIALGKVKPHTIRNNKNKLSLLFRHANAQQLLSLPPAQLVPRYNDRTKPPRPGSVVSHKTGAYLLYKDWPSDLQNAFRAFQTWATSPVVPERNAAFKKRPQTVESYRHHCEAYFGYLAYIQHLPTLHFEQLFDITLVTAFVHWHINDLHQRPTLTIRDFLKCLLALTRQYRPQSELRTQLAALKRTLPVPPPVYNKDDAWVSLATLQDIARDLWPRKQPKDIQRSSKRAAAGSRSAVYAGFSLMLHLWTYRPYRSRNMREMRLDENLHKDAQGQWHITFRSEQLKIATKRGRPNVFDLPFPDKLVPLLEDYLATWRPILLAKASHPQNHVFLTQHGTPYGRDAIRFLTQGIVYRYTGKHWHPHIIRTVWATEWIRNGGDFHTAAIMLNDRLETVISKYSFLLDEDVASKADRFIEARNGQGK